MVNDKDNKPSKISTHYDLERVLIESDFNFKTDYSTDEEIRYYQIYGSEYHLFKSIIDDFSKSPKNLLVSSQSNLDQTNNYANVNFKLVLQDNLLDLTYDGFYSNIIFLTKQIYKLLDGLNKNNFDYDLTTSNNLIKLNCKGGSDIDELINLVWDVEDSNLCPIFDFFPYVDPKGELVKKVQYESKLGLYIIEYQID